MSHFNSLLFPLAAVLCLSACGPGPPDGPRSRGTIPELSQEAHWPPSVSWPKMTWDAPMLGTDSQITTGSSPGDIPCSDSNAQFMFLEVAVTNTNTVVMSGLILKMALVLPTKPQEGLVIPGLTGTTVTSETSQFEIGAGATVQKDVKVPGMCHVGPMVPPLMANTGNGILVTIVTPWIVPALAAQIGSNPSNPKSCQLRWDNCS